jgi:sarcosine oxidase subunit gamma
VPDNSLKPQSALAGYDRQFDGVTLQELTGLSLVSIAVPMGGRDELARATESVFGVTLPDAGSSIYSEAGRIRLLGLQRDQLFLAIEYQGDDAVALTRGKLGNAGYYTDQSDSWAMLRIAGPGCRRALNRICMLNLDSNTFAIGTVSRTTMEHLAVIILRDGPDSFLLLSPRSSARSFLHAVERSIINTA